MKIESEKFFQLHRNSSFCFTNAFLNGMNRHTTMQYVKVFNSIFRNFAVFYFHWFVVRRRNFNLGWCTDRTFTDIRNFWLQTLLSHVRAYLQIIFIRFFDDFRPVTEQAFLKDKTEWKSMRFSRNRVERLDAFALLLFLFFCAQKYVHNFCVYIRVEGGWEKAQ